MNNNWDKYLDPPDEPPYCEDGCGETLVRTPFSDGWFCNNKFCPTKFSGVEKEMAELILDLKDKIQTLEWKIRGNNK